MAKGINIVMSKYTQQYELVHKEERKDYAAEYYKAHKAEVKKYQQKRGWSHRRTYVRQYRKQRYYTDPNYKLEVILRNRFLDVLKTKGVGKQVRSLSLLGCSIQELREHIESKWQPGMTWTNHGYGQGKWHIDHVIPCSAFDLSYLTEQRKCFHYTNLQPLWQRDNLSKGDKV